MLKLRDLAHFYGNQLVFKNINLEISAGITLMAGPNGAGKSTLLSIMAGLIEPSHGLLERSEDCRAAMLGHQSFLYPEMTALENLKFWSLLHGFKHTEQELDETLEMVSLAHVKYEQSSTFSRGMTQRLSLARVFLLNPNLMLLDEPGTGLDSFSMEILHKEIKKAAARNVAVVWISHNLDKDFALADNIILIENKELAYYGSAKEYENFLKNKTMPKDEKSQENTQAKSQENTQENTHSLSDERTKKADRPDSDAASLEKEPSFLKEARP